MSHTIQTEPDLQRILFCTDFSDNANRAFEFAVGAAPRHRGATFYLLHVIPEPEAQFWKTYVYEVEDVDRKARQDIDEKIRTAYLSRVPDTIDLRTEIRIGREAAEILSFASEHNIDLIIMGRQGNSRLGSFLSGSVTAKVTHKARCPVLIVPDTARRRPDPPEDKSNP